MLTKHNMLISCLVFHLDFPVLFQALQPKADMRLMKNTMQRVRKMIKGQKYPFYLEVEGIGTLQPGR